MVRAYRYIFACCLALSAYSAALASDYSDCTILSSSASTITFLYRAPSFAWASSGERTYAAIPNTALDSRDGLPPVAGRVVYIAVPPGTSFVDAQVSSLSAIEHLSPPQPNTSAGETVNFPYPDARVRVDGIHTMHGVRMARLVLHPALVVAFDGSIELAREMTVTLRIDGAESRPTAQVSDRGPFAGVLDQILLNPDDALISTASPAFKTAVDLNPFSGGGQWVAIRTRGDGAHAVSAGALTLAGISIATVDPSQMRLFAGPGRQLSTRVSEPPPPLTEVAIEWQGDDDNILESGEQFVFWADGLNRWDVDSLGRMTDVVHRYDRDNVYWLALSHSESAPPLRTGNLSAPPLSGGADVFSGVDRARHEEENMFRVASSGFIESYYTWYWRNQRSGVITFFNTRNADPDKPARIEMGTWAGTAADFHPRISINGSTVLPFSVRERQGEDRSTLSVFDLAAFNPGNDHELFFDPTVFYYLDFYTVEYSRRLDLSQGAFKFAAPDTTLQANFVVTNAGTARVWDITNPNAPLEVIDVTRDGTALRFGASLTKGARRVFFAFNESAQRVPRSITPVALVDLHTPATGADYLAIGPRTFTQPTGEFLVYRSGTDALQTRYIAVEDIYNSFSLGIQDPLAIRRFLKHTHTDWPGEKPAYCLLVGDGTNDYLNNTGSNSVNYVMPYIVRDEVAVSDESYIYFSDRSVLDAEGNTADNPLPDMLIGRWPVKTAQDIATITAKIKEYESVTNLGQWRSRVMMIADDEFGDRGASASVREDFHIRDAESIAITHIPPRFAVQKVYLTEYPFDNPTCYEPAAVGCRKPTAKEAIVNAINEGVLVVDYLGHGNPDVLAHERVFERQVDLPRLTNSDKLTSFFAFSCSIGFFDEPESEGMAEELLRMPGGGAVAVTSATRVSGALQNASFNQVVFDLLFERGVDGIGAALYTAKLLRQYNDPFCRLFENCETLPCPCSNDRGYVLFGDPAMHLGGPQMRVDFTSIVPDSLSALTPTQVSGRITDTAGLIQPGFDGTLFVTVRDVPRQRVYPIDQDLSINYELPGGTLYRGQVAVENGEFSFVFIVPKDIAYGQTGAVIMGHAVGATSMANGARDSLRLAGSPSAIVDTTGPMIQLLTDEGETIADGFHVAQNSTLSVVIIDPSGINMTGSSGHRLEVFSSASESPLADLTDAFIYDPGAADRGRAQFSVAGLEVGRHHLTIKAWDNANNSTLLEYDIEIVAGESNTGFALTEFLNHPNPFDGVTTFYFRATRAIREAKIRLFTLAGRMIWEASASDGMTTWDGRDNAGDQVANGVYLAQIEAVGLVLAEGGELVDKKAYREMKVVVSR
jgi:hypothetical protein